MEYVVRLSLVHILETEHTWQHFKTKSCLLEFWNLLLSDQEYELVGSATIDLMDGTVEFDEAQWLQCRP